MSSSRLSEACGEIVVGRRADRTGKTWGTSANRGGSPDFMTK